LVYFSALLQFFFQLAIVHHQVDASKNQQDGHGETQEKKEAYEQDQCYNLDTKG
jgi:hypothetical protein